MEKVMNVLSAYVVTNHFLTAQHAPENRRTHMELQQG
jgi:hypothetical protein